MEAKPTDQAGKGLCIPVCLRVHEQLDQSVSVAQRGWGRELFVLCDQPPMRETSYRIRLMSPLLPEIMRHEPFVPL